METAKQRKMSLTGRLLILASLLFMVIIVVHAIISINYSHKSIRNLMERRMLNITNSASAMVKGDDLRKLKGHVSDNESDAYKRIVDKLSIFMNNVNLEYIYAVKKLDNGFGVVCDPDMQAADEYGEIIETTPALEAAMEGVASVDQNSTEDRWGEFYSAYSPVYDSKMEVAGVIAVDFKADWYEERSSSHDFLIILICVLTMIGSLFVVIVMTGRARQEIAEHLRESQELKRMKEAAQNANNVKSTFLEHVSQETRNPIHTILDMDDRILDTTHTERTLVCARNIHQAGETLLEMINDVLDYSAIEAGRIRIEESSYDVVTFLSNIVNAITPEVREKGLRFEIHVDEVLPKTLSGDSVHLTQIIMNLLLNAVKYTNDGEIMMTVFMQAMHGDKVHIRFGIEDTGVGISLEDQDRLFEPFEKVEKPGFDDGGSGLGLAVANQLLLKMDSCLEVESLVGQGSIFSFTVEQTVVKDDPIGDYEQARIRSYREENVN